MKIGTFNKTVTAAGTAEPLQAERFVVKKVAIKSLAANTGLIYVGDSSVDAAGGYEIAMGGSCGLDPFDNRGSETSIDLNDVYIDAATSGEGVCVLYGYDESSDPTA